MQYTEDFIDKAVDLTKKKGLSKASHKLNVPKEILNSWVDNNTVCYSSNDPREENTVKESLDFLCSLAGF